MLFAADLSYRGWFPGWLAVALGAAALLGVVALYWSEMRRRAGRGLFAGMTWREPVGVGLLGAAIAAGSLGLFQTFRAGTTALPEAAGRGVQAVAWLLAAGLAGLGFLFVFPRGPLPRWAGGTLAGLRALFLFTVLFLVLKPTLLMEHHGERPRPVAVLVDDSQSMTQQDPRPNLPDRWRVAVANDLVPPDRPVPAMPSADDLPANTPEKPSRTEVAKASLSNPRLDLLRRLERRDKFRDGVPVQPATFGLTRSPKETNSREWVAKLGGQEPRTALADGVYELLRRDEKDLPSAVVLVTDGRENASQRSLEELSRECVRLKVPVFVYGVGSSSFGHVQIREATVPENLFVDDTVSVPVRYRVRGFKEGRAEITVEFVGREGKKEVARKVVDVKEGEDLREVLSFVPQQTDAQPGKQELITTVRVFAGADTVTDEVTKSVRVVDRKIKVLVVDSLPRWDFKYLQRALLRDRRVEPSFFLSEGDRKAMEAGFPFLPRFPTTRPELFAYDLLVLGDLPASVLAPEQQQWVREFVAEGGGLIHVAGRNHGPRTFVGTPLADVLPVEVPAAQFPIDSGARPKGFRPDLTPVGLRSPLLSLADDPVESVRVWRTLPEIYWTYPVTKVKPAAEVLLTHPTEKTADGKPMPMLAVHYYGKGYVLFSGFDETWRWRFNEADRFFGRYWSQAIYVAGVPRTVGTKLTQLSLDTPDPQLGRTGQVYARLFTPDLKPVAADRVEAKLERLDAGPEDRDRAAAVELKAVPGQPGEYVGTVPFNRVGRFALKMDAGTDPASLEYRTTLPPDHELAPGGMAEDDLRHLAESTGGKFYREEDLRTLPDDVPVKTAPYTEREEVLLWDRWWVVAWCLGLLTAEWFLRKFHSLS